MQLWLLINLVWKQWTVFENGSTWLTFQTPNKSSNMTGLLQIKPPYSTQPFKRAAPHVRQEEQWIIQRWSVGEGRPENQLCISQRQGNILSIINELKDDFGCLQNKLTNHNRHCYDTDGFGPRYITRNFETWSETPMLLYKAQCQQHSWIGVY